MSRRAGSHAALAKDVPYVTMDMITAVAIKSFSTSRDCRPEVHEASALVTALRLRSADRATRMAIAGPLEGGMARTPRTHTQERHPTVGPGTRPLDLVVRVLRVALSRSKRLERASQSGSARPCRCPFANTRTRQLQSSS